MLNPDIELDRLRSNLGNWGWSPSEVDSIIEVAAEDINNIIVEAVSNATSEAITHAETIGAQDFIDDIDVIQQGSIYLVSTKSGNTDFSILRTENLPNLLKNAKTAVDGSRYKVIPMRDKKPRMGVSTFQSMSQQDRDVQAARSAITEKAQANRSAKATAMADQFRQNLARTISVRRKDPAQSMGEPTFRTASSKQDPSKDWVIPEIDRDMTQYLLDLNDRIKDTVQAAVSTTISFYEQEYGKHQ